MARIILDESFRRFILDKNWDITYRNPFNINPPGTENHTSNEQEGGHEEPDDIQTVSSDTAPTKSEPEKENDLYFHRSTDDKCSFLDLGKESLLKGIILSEILGKPRAKRGFGR